MKALRLYHIIRWNVLRQALHDATSTDSIARDEAQRFLRDRRALTFWTTLAGIEPEKFAALLAQTLSD